MTYLVKVYRVTRIDTGDPVGILDAPIASEPVLYEADDREEVDRIVLDFLAAHPEYTRASVHPVKA